MKNPQSKKKNPKISTNKSKKKDRRCFNSKHKSNKNGVMGKGLYVDMFIYTYIFSAPIA